MFILIDCFSHKNIKWLINWHFNKMPFHNTTHLHYHFPKLAALRTTSWTINGFTSVKYFMDRTYHTVHWFPVPFTISTTAVTSYHAWQLASAFLQPLFCHPIRIERPVLAAWAAATWHYFWRILRGQTSLKKKFRKNYPPPPIPPPLKMY